MLETDGPALIDMILTEMAAPTPKTVLPDWYNNFSNGGEFSNCPSSVTTDEEIGLDVLDMAPLEWSFLHGTDGI